MTIEEGFNYIEEYSNGETERGKKLRKSICDKLGFASLEFQSLEGIIKAIGLPESDLCTYCWNGKE
jgi:amidophosphoribosyltransferase